MFSEVTTSGSIGDYNRTRQPAALVVTQVQLKQSGTNFEQLLDTGAAVRLHVAGTHAESVEARAGRG